MFIKCPCHHNIKELCNFQSNQTRLQARSNSFSWKEKAIVCIIHFNQSAILFKFHSSKYHNIVFVNRCFGLFIWHKKELSKVLTTFTLLVLFQAHRNGYVTFADEKVWSPGYFRDNKLIAPCMVEIKDNYNLGIIRFLVTSEEYLLNRATVDVTSHFVTEADFKAHQVVIIEWNGLLSQVQGTITCFYNNL